MIDTSWAVRTVERLPGRAGWAPREEWGDGPWQDEPDLVEWRCRGYACLAVRGPSGSWCGYVGVPGSHPWHGRHYDRAPIEGAHGELTFSNTCSGYICHQPSGNEAEHVWWLGFDCAHAGDLSPALQALTRRLETPEMAQNRKEYEAILGRPVYRSLSYVRTRVELMAYEAYQFAKGRQFPVVLDDLVASAKLFLLRDLPKMWREIYLERDWMGRGPLERECLEACYGGNRMDPDGPPKMLDAQRRDRFWPW